MLWATTREGCSTGKASRNKSIIVFGTKECIEVKLEEEQKMEVIIWASCSQEGRPYWSKFLPSPDEACPRSLDHRDHQRPPTYHKPTYPTMPSMQIPSPPWQPSARVSPITYPGYQAFKKRCLMLSPGFRSGASTCRAFSFSKDMTTSYEFNLSTVGFRHERLLVCCQLYTLPLLMPY